MDIQPKSRSNRILATPSSYAKKNYLFVQEVGTLTSLLPHISKRQNLNSFLFMVLTEGEGILRYKNETKTIYAGDCVWIDCSYEYEHESSTQNPWTLHWVHFYGINTHQYYSHYLEQMFTSVFTPRNLNLFVDLIQSLYHVQKVQESFMELICNQYLVQLITLCFTENQTLIKTDQSMQLKLKEIKTYIDAHAFEKLSLDSLSDHFFISKYHLSREFSKTFGITIGNQITAKRISKAKSLLRFSTDSIEDIAMGCGFQDSGYFIKVFKKLENMTPLAYRKKW